MIKKILLFLLAALIIIQFIHPAKNKSIGVQLAYIGNKHQVPGDVYLILQKACLDCHSNNTNYPWYSRLQPVDWWMDSHIRDGKKELNLDEFTHKSLRYQYHKLEEITEQVNENKMPLESYTWIHKDAKLTASEKTRLGSWSDALRDSMRAIYPPDSLERKKDRKNP